MKDMQPNRPTPRRRAASVWHEEAHPGLTHSIVAVGAFFAGVLILGALAVSAETSSSPTVISQLNEITIQLNLLTRRVDTIEEKINSGLPSEPILASNCDTLEQALPVIQNIRQVPSSVACYEAPGVNHPDRKFLSITALYQYLDQQDDTKEITVQIYDLGDDAQAAADFLSKGAYLPVDYDRVKREDVQINGLIGTFTYDGIATNNAEYERAANWFVINNRFGVVVHGEALGFTSRDVLDEITEAVGTDILMNIR
jgi:hypothetical protein